MNKNKNKNLLSSGFIIGSLIGASLTFFLAPQRGIETQKKVVKSLNRSFQKSIIKVQNYLINFEILLEKNSNEN